MTTQLDKPEDEPLLNSQGETKPITDVTVEWDFSIPARSGKQLLLTIGGICVTGDWYGRLGEYFAAHAPMPKYDIAKFNEVISNFRQSLNNGDTLH